MEGGKNNHNEILNDLVEIQDIIYEYYPDMEKIPFEINVNN